MKKAICVLIVAVILCGMVACSTDPYAKEDKALQGRWKCTIASDLYAIYNFEDGSFSCETFLYGEGLGAKYGTYTITDTTIDIVYSEGDNLSSSLEYSYGSGKLTIKLSDSVYLIKED